MNQSETKLRWGLIAPGAIARQIVSDFQVAGMTFVAVAGRNLDRAKSFAADFGIPVSSSIEDLLQNPSVDVVYIASTQDAHLENVLAAVSAGKHVVVEKPFALTGDQAQKMVEAARSAQVFLMEAMWTRFLPHMTKAFEIINSGVLGEIKSMEASFGHCLPPEVAPRLHNPALGGGALIDLGIYPVSLAVRAFGIPQAIQAASVLDHQNLDQTTSLIFSYQDGRQANLMTSIATVLTTTASIYGTKARLEIGHPFFENAPLRVVNNDGEVLETFEAKIEGRGMQFQGLEAERQILAGNLESPIMPLDETVAIMRLMDEVRAITGIKYAGE